MLYWIQASVVIVPLAAVFAFGTFFASSFVVVALRHPRGTLVYVAKVAALGLVIVPVAIVLTLWALGSISASAYVWVKTRLIGERDAPVPDAMTRPNDDQPDEVIVHLVHGTFEQNAAWTLPGSPMREKISRANPEAKFRRFLWSGLNTLAERRIAARELAGKIWESQSKRHFIVAHSHGGNIVREMSQIAPHVAAKIEGVNLLSPPFIFRRKIQRTGGKFVLIHSMGAGLVAQIPVAAATLPFGLYGLPAGALTFLLVMLIENRLAKTYAAELAQELESADEGIHFRNVEILHAIGDEADSVLRFVSFLHEACFGIFSQLQAAKASAESKPYGPYWLSLLALATGALWMAFQGDDDRWIWAAATALAFLMIVVAGLKQRCQPSRDEPAILVLAALPAAIFSFWLGAAKSLAYGDWRLLFAPNIFICSSETPAGDHAVLKYAPQADGALVHSTHSHPQAIADVAAWLQLHLSGRWRE